MNSPNSGVKSNGLTPARVRSLGMRHADLAEADAVLGWRYSLIPLLRERADLRAAWERGKLLRELRTMAAGALSRGQAARRLHMSLVDFHRLVSQDLEANEAWNGGRLDAVIAARQKALDIGDDDRARALERLEQSLCADIVQAEIDPHRVSEDLVCKVFGITRQTLNRWQRAFGCPGRTAAGAYDLVALVEWYRPFIRTQCSGSGRSSGNGRDAGDWIEMQLRIRRKDLSAIVEGEG